MRQIVDTMNMKLKGNWNTIKGKLKERYSHLTDDDLLYVEGKKDQLVGRLQKLLGKTKDEINRLLKELNEKVLAK